MADTVSLCRSIFLEIDVAKDRRTIGDIGPPREAIDVTADGEVLKGVA